MEKLIITDINGFGDGVTRIDNKAIFVSKTLPGDQVTIKNQVDYKRYSKAQINQIIVNSPQRDLAFCQHFDLCGGCQIQATKAEEYQNIKMKIFSNLSRYILKDHVSEIICGNHKTNFRNKAVFNFSPNTLQLVYQDINEDELVIQDCSILEESLQILLKELQTILPNHPELKDQNLKKIFFKSLPNQKAIVGFDIKQSPNNQSLLEEICLELEGHISGAFFFHSPSSHFAVSKPKWILSPDNAYEVIDQIKIPYSPEMFFQSNREVMQLIYQKISLWVQESGAKNILDLYTGVGGTLLSMGKHIDFGLGLEVNANSIQVAKQIKKDNALKHLKFQTANLPRGLKNALRNQVKFDLCMVNPPRKGLGQKMIQESIQSLPDQIIYLSCNPSSLESDLKQFEKDGYQLKKVEVFDMFPWTNHFETLAFIEKR
ncbi:23S rRNA (uracil(1939)-C(5))-methyltransferase RlmD [bacterium]|nr:23S rRNA (uracil(1939)-C(5))-methyltransferase RlmD [bacterium]